MQSKMCLNIWTKTWHSTTLAGKAPNSSHLVWADEYLLISVSLHFLMLEISPFSISPLQSVYSPLPKTGHLCPLCLECFRSSCIHSIPQSNPTFPTYLSGAWPCAKVLPQVLPQPMPQRLPQAFLHATFNHILDQNSGTQGCLLSGSLPLGGNDLVPMCISAQNLQHEAERVNGAFHVSPAHFPCSGGGSVCSIPTAGRAWTTDPWRGKGAAFWPPASSSVWGITLEPREETGPTLTFSFFFLKRGKKRFWTAQMGFFIFFCSGHLTENINYFHSHRHSSKLPLFMTSAPVEIYGFIITEDSASTLRFP